MMHVLIVKTSSLGDIIHTFPALTDAVHSIEGIQFDWVVEQGFRDMPGWHPAVNQIIPSSIRHWRKSWLKTWTGGDWKRFIKQLQSRKYDAVIDAQGLIKSALITRKALGEKHGLDKYSARESLASLAYNYVYSINKQQHAIERTRQLFAQALDYSIEDLPLQYGLSVVADKTVNKQSILFLHGTTWQSKQWPMAFWSALAARIVDTGYQVLLPAVNKAEKIFAQTLAAESESISVLPEKSLSEMAALIQAVGGVVSVDTGLAHLAAALDVPSVALYGATDARLTGILGNRQQSLQANSDCSPCLSRQCPLLSAANNVPPCTETLNVDDVWRTLQENL